MAAPAYAADNLAGTWRLNVSKSKYSAGAPPKSQVTKIEAVDGGIREIVDRVNADGKKVHWEWTVKYDGKDYPVNGDPDRDAASIRRIDDYTVEVVNKKNGKVTTTMRIVVARDGKTRTNAVTGVNAAGQKVDNVLFFEKE